MSSLIVLLGMGLVILNGWNNGQLAIGWSIIYDNSSSSVTSDQQTAIFVLGGEVLLVILLASVASTNQTAAKFGVIIFSALWVLWFLKNPSTLSAITTRLGSQGITPSPTLNTSPFTLPSPHIPTSFTIPSSTTTKGK